MPLTTTGRIIRLGAPAVVSICIISLQKYLFEEVDHSDQYFRKPLFLTFVLSLGLCAVLIIALIRHIIFKRRRQGRIAVDSQESLSIPKRIAFAIVPGVAIFFGLFFTSVGLVWLDASYLQVFGLASVLYPSLFRIFILKNSRGVWQFISLGFLTVGIVLVIVAAYEHGLNSDQSIPARHSVLGAVLALGGQCVTSVVPALEDWFFGGTTTPTTLIVGLEGLFATLLAGPIFLPIASLGSSVQGSGISEDTKETLDMLGQSTSLLLAVLGLAALGTLHGTARAFINPAATERGLAVALIVQTVAVWVFQLILKAALGNGEYGKKHPLMGEEWTKWSWLELAGFVMAAVGVLVNANVIKLKRGETESGINETPLISA